MALFLTVFVLLTGLMWLLYMFVRWLDTIGGYMLQGVISESALWTTSKKLVSRSFGAKPPCQDLMKNANCKHNINKSGTQDPKSKNETQETEHCKRHNGPES